MPKQTTVTSGRNTEPLHWTYSTKMAATSFKIWFLIYWNIRDPCLLISVKNPYGIVTWVAVVLHRSYCGYGGVHGGIIPRYPLVMLYVVQTNPCHIYFSESFYMFGYRIGRRIPLVIYFLIGGVALLSTLPIVLTGVCCYK